MQQKTAVHRFITIGDIARLNDLPIWKVRRLFERKLLPEPARVGVYRVFTEADLPKIEDALRSAGYLPRQEVPYGA